MLSSFRVCLDPPQFPLLTNGHQSTTHRMHTGCITWPQTCACWTNSEPRGACGHSSFVLIVEKPVRCPPFRHHAPQEMLLQAPWSPLRFCLAHNYYHIVRSTSRESSFSRVDFSFTKKWHCPQLLSGRKNSTRERVDAQYALCHAVDVCWYRCDWHRCDAGDVDHLVATYILAHQINHGIQLRKIPSLQYLYYLSQVSTSDVVPIHAPLSSTLSRSRWLTQFCSSLPSSPSVLWTLPRWASQCRRCPTTSSFSIITKTLSSSTCAREWTVSSWSVSKCLE